jgi:hypothetical protein
VRLTLQTIRVLGAAPAARALTGAETSGRIPSTFDLRLSDFDLGPSISTFDS